MFLRRFKPWASNITVLRDYRARITNLHGESTVVSFVRRGNFFFGVISEGAQGSWSMFEGKQCEFILTEKGTITELERNQWDDPWL